MKAQGHDRINVQNDPVNFVDPLGLLESDVQLIWNDILIRYPEIDPSGDYIFTDDYGPCEGGTRPFTGDISISTYYLKHKLTESEFICLYQTLLHEMMHSTDPWWRRWLDRGDGPLTVNHQSIYQRVAYEMGDRVSFDVDKSIKAGKIVPDRPFWGLNSNDVVINQDARNPNNIKNAVTNLYNTSR